MLGWVRESRIRHTHGCLLNAFRSMSRSVASWLRLACVALPAPVARPSARGARGQRRTHRRHGATDGLGRRFVAHYRRLRVSAMWLDPTRELVSRSQQAPEARRRSFAVDAVLGPGVAPPNPRRRRASRGSDWRSPPRTPRRPRASCLLSSSPRAARSAPDPVPDLRSHRR